MIVRDLIGKSEDELLQMLQDIDNEPIEWTPVIVALLTLKTVEKALAPAMNVESSSRRLERLTKWLIALTFALALLALPPAIEVTKTIVTGKPRDEAASAPRAPESAQLQREFKVLHSRITETQMDVVNRTGGSLYEFVDRGANRLGEMRSTARIGVGDRVTLADTPWRVVGLELRAVSDKGCKTISPPAGFVAEQPSTPSAESIPCYSIDTVRVTVAAGK